MKKLNVKSLYIGMESGSDKVLSNIKKGVTQEEMLEAANRISEAGISYNVSVILGLGEVKDSEKQFINLMKPNRLRTTILNPQSGTPLYEDVVSGKFELPTYRDILREERDLLEGIDAGLPMYIWTGGFLPGAGVVDGNFPEDRERIMKAISERQIANRLFNQKIMIGGSL